MRFVTPAENNQLSDEEYELALRCLERTRMAMAERDRRQDAAAYGQNVWVHKGGDRNWAGAERNPLSTSTVLLQGDRDVIRNLRLYCQMFTGYSLAYMQPTDRCPWITAKLPDNHVPPSKPDYGSAYARSMRGMVPPLASRFGECGWLDNDVLLNFDQWYYWEKIVLLDQCGITMQPHVLEIGGGFGGLASMFMRNGPHRYTIIDLPESLAFASIYLSILFPNMMHFYPVTSEELVTLNTPGFTFVPSYLHRELVGKYHADLVINMQSMREMSETQVEEYAQTIQGVMTPEGKFFEQNAPAEAGRIDVAEILGKYFPQPEIGHFSAWGVPRIWRQVTAPSSLRETV